MNAKRTGKNLKEKKYKLKNEWHFERENNVKMKENVDKRKYNINNEINSERFSLLNEKWMKIWGKNQDAKNKRFWEKTKWKMKDILSTNKTKNKHGLKTEKKTPRKIKINGKRKATNISKTPTI